MRRAADRSNAGLRALGDCACRAAQQAPSARRRRRQRSRLRLFLHTPGRFVRPSLFSPASTCRVLPFSTRSRWRTTVVIYDSISIRRQFNGGATAYQRSSSAAAHTRVCGLLHLMTFDKYTFNYILCPACRLTVAR